MHNKRMLLKSPLIICLTASLFFFYEAIQMAMFNSLSASIMRSFNINGVQLANLSAAYFYTNIVFLVPSGLLLDKFSTKWLLVGAMSLSVIGTFFFSFSTNYEWALFSRMISGVGASFCFIGNIKLISQWFPRNRMALFTGALITMGFLGGIVAQTPFLFLNNIVGWQHATLILSMLGIVVIILIACFAKDNTFFVMEKHALNDCKTLRYQLKIALSNRYTWLGGGYIMLMNMSMLMLATLWNNLFLKEIYHLLDLQSSFISVALFAGIMIGAPLVGLAANNIHRKRNIMLIAPIFSGIAVLFIINIHMSFYYLMLIYFFLGFLSSAQCLGYAEVINKNKLYIAATATSIASILIMGGGVFFKILFGWILDATWHGGIIYGIRLYSAYGFHVGLSVLFFSFIMAFFVALKLTSFKSYSHSLDLENGTSC